MKTSLLFLFAFGAQLASTSLQAGDALQDTRQVLDQWVETRRITSKETSDWQLEQSILTDTQSLLTNELSRVNKSLQTLETSATAADQARTLLTAEQEALAEASAVVEASIGDLETQIKQMLTMFPEPLVNTIKPLIRRLPKDPASTRRSLGERVQNIVGILSQADQFNATITTTSEAREIQTGKVVEVRTLYWGLAMAYYIDPSGTYAGIGFPGENGWEWPAIDRAGAAIQQLLKVYDGSGDIQFIEVPARIH